MGDQEVSECVPGCGFGGGRNVNGFLSGEKREQHRCVWPTIPVELFSVCLLYPTAPWVPLKRLWVIIKPVTKLLHKERCACLVSVWQTTHVHTNDTFFLVNYSVWRCWAFTINTISSRPFSSIFLLICKSVHTLETPPINLLSFFPLKFKPVLSHTPGKRSGTVGALNHLQSTDGASRLHRHLLWSALNGH